MTKLELAQAVSLKTGVEVLKVIEIIDASNQVIIKTNAKGEGVYMRGFGSYTPKTRKQKIGRNIHAGTAVLIPEHSIPFFKPSPEFKNLLK